MIRTMLTLLAIGIVSAVTGISYRTTRPLVSHVRTWDRYSHTANRSPRLTMGARKARYVARKAV